MENKNYIYKVVRTYDEGDKMMWLEKAFNEGYEFVHASEHVEETLNRSTRRFGYIEYILRKEV